LSVLRIDAGRPGAEVLAWSRDLVEPALRGVVDRLPAPTRRITGYHFGWNDKYGEPDAGPDQVGRGGAGKAIRSALVLLSAQAAGGTAAQAMPAACAIELVHNFSLLHDDVMDGDRTRRHRPAGWVVFGVGPAILAGDALLTLAFDVLTGAGGPDGAAQALSSVLYQLVDGQSADLSFEERDEVGLAECVRMAEGKTGALIGGACRLGCLAGGGNRDQADRLSAFGQHVGLAFQFVDDLLGIWGDPAVTGKPVYADLTRRKKSAPVVAALNSGTPQGQRLRELYRGAALLEEGSLGEAELETVAALIESAGGRAWAEEQAHQHLTQGLACLVDAGLSASPRNELENLARIAVHRDR
jgi:geranylgeranyl diphosphate synthase type I